MLQWRDESKVVALKCPVEANDVAAAFSEHHINLPLRFRTDIFNPAFAFFTSTVPWGNLPANPIFKAVALPDPEDEENNAEVGGRDEPVQQQQDAFELPATYELPPFPGLRRDMEANGGEISTGMQNLMINIIYKQVVGLMGNKRSVKPGTYKSIADMLCNRYPSSRSRRVVVLGVRQVHRQYETWLNKLRSKFRCLRRGVVSAEIEEARAKYTPTKIFVPTPLIEASPQRGYLSLLPTEMDEGETEATLLSHQADIAAEWRKPQPCMAVITHRLERTKISRRRLMATSTPSKVLEKFPIYSSFKMVILKAKLQSGRDLGVSRGLFLTRERVKRALKSCLEMRYSRPMKRMVKFLQMCSAHEMEAAERDFVLTVVPIAAKEDMRVWVVFDEDVATEFPTLRVVSKEGESPFANFEIIEVWVWKEKLCHASGDCGVTFSEGLDALIAASFMFNITHPDASLKSWRFVSEQVYMYEGPPPSQANRGKYPRLAAMYGV